MTGESLTGGVTDSYDTGTITEILTCLKPGITEIAECLNPGTDVAPPSKRWKCASAKQVLKLGAM